MKASLISIVGPTGVGKSAFSLELAQKCTGSILNGDMGQLYEPLSCGTAKPAWKNEPIPHHLFDVISQPQDFSVIQYRRLVEKQIIECEAKGRQPLIVGGSLFYNKALFFPPRGPASGQCTISEASEADLWNDLYRVDPMRARAIHRNDAYRINRALSLIYTLRESSLVASNYSPFYNPVRTKALFLHITRDRIDLYRRIDHRVEEMLAQGWMEEVRGLSHDWREWLKKKKIIGYNELIEELERGKQVPSVSCIEHIKQRTRNYAKRQLTLWRSYRKQLEENGNRTVEINLTLHSFDLYLERLFECELRGAVV